MAYVHEADFVKHESLLRLEQATQSLMARRFYNGNRELANAALRLKQNPPSDWHSFRQGMHLGVRFKSNFIIFFFIENIPQSGLSHASCLDLVGKSINVVGQRKR